MQKFEVSLPNKILKNVPKLSPSGGGRWQQNLVRTLLSVACSFPGKCPLSHARVGRSELHKDHDKDGMAGHDDDDCGDGDEAPEGLVETLGTSVAGVTGVARCRPVQE